ncbi:uncharacterized protein TrAFT101_010733 [Trichoderma asperellum]|uniref:Glycoside hydrolase family 43 protein n=1 Tax=Trichoderma asperellum (strain ATCC 204424 / CBS 433.97 / NBRC 101777) TaxID=1042311 RepID=A0A2T3YR83_TRIA4|nr:hypothetical protein M441DRAFT_52403 [Trichoderma asperellum CBS 433.97]PTB35091.1 hypothetical protein M441DRAFT_52403 [Trichoderma asperellum CBS 433.97]UKZ95925.1 hypothetical protein TrAFT101_010733 [Trichoderma asperellum]
MIITYLTKLATFALFTHAWAADITISPVTNADPGAKTGHFSDPFHVVYQDAKDLYISGTTHKYLKCNSGDLSAGCASLLKNKYETGSALNQTAHAAGTKICGAAGIHPFQSKDRSWDALVTLHVQSKPKKCDGISGWSVIVHARSKNPGPADSPPTSWIGDKVMIGTFSDNVDANYDGKYFETPDGKLYLVYQKQESKKPKRDGVAAWPMNNPTTLTPGSSPTFLLLPGEELNSENYVSGKGHFKLIETGNIHAINGKFFMAYSVGAYNRNTYKIGIAYSDTFLPAPGQQYRKVMKNNPDHLWDSKRKKEVYYFLQSEEKHDGWHYIGDQVLAPGVPTVAQIGPNNSWVLLFAGYNPKDAPTKDGTDKYQASHRRPYFTKVNVNIPDNLSVKQATDEQLQRWITPSH